MSREIRRVPPDWVHPKYWHQYAGRPYEKVPHPLYDETYEDAVRDWLRDKEAWDKDQPLPSDWQTPKRTRSQIMQEVEKGTPEEEVFSNFSYAPDPSYYRHRRWTPEEATAYQVYETVSEGTPVSPVCATKEDLIFWLSHATVEMYGRPFKAMSPTGARRFAEEGHAFSAIGSPGHGVETGLEYLDRVAREEEKGHGQ